MTGSALNRGMNTGLENLAWGLAEKGVDVTILVGGCKPLSHDYEVPENVNYAFLGHELKTPLEFITKYKEIVRSKRIDVVFGWLENIAVLSDVKINSEKPIFISNEGRRPIRSIYLRALKWFLVRRLSFIQFWRYVRAIKKVDDNIESVVSITKAVEENVYKYYHINKPKNYVVHRSVDLDVFKPAQVKPEYEAIKLLFTGNIIPDKGITDLVYALKKIKYIKPVHVDLCGRVDDIYRAWIEAELSNYNNLSVEFHGKISQHKVVEFCQNADVFIFCSHPMFEGLGKSLIEAMACGCAVVCSNIDVFKEVVVDKYSGLMVPTHNHKKLAEAIDAFLEDEKLRCSCALNARKTVEEKFSREREVDKWLNILKEYR